MIRKATASLEDTLRAGLPAGDALEWFERSDWARILTETFYFNTGRIGQLLKHPSWIPHVGDPGFIGAFMVRHKLVEHYDADGSDYEQGPSFGLGGSNGPTLQPGMSREWTGPGLYVNARELAEVLERRLTAAIERLREGWGQPPPGGFSQL